MQALDIIQAENRGMWRVASALDALGASLTQPQHAQASAASIASLLDYIDRYVDAIHHPKEDTYLFKVLRQRDANAAADIDRLEREHRDGPRYRDELRSMACDVAAGRD